MTPVFRRAHDDDMAAAYAMFRRSVFDYLSRVGLATAEEAADPPVTSAWLRQAEWIRHLWTTAAENWVATDEAEVIIGWALSVQRGGHLELAFFFVDPASAARGVGSRLLDLAFGSRPEQVRTIMATQDPAALSLYLRHGVGLVTTAVDFCVVSQPRPPTGSLVFRALTPAKADVEAVCAIERDILGLDRPEDIAFLIGNRPGWLAQQDGQPVGYAFGAQPLPPEATDFPPTIGPIGALDDQHLPDLIDRVIDATPPGTDLYFAVPLQNRRATAHLLGLKARIDPFYLAVLSSEKEMQLDRYIHTAPSFII